MTEKIVEGEEYRLGIQRGINKLADTVKDTLGPSGNTVLIKNAFGEILITKDGASVAEEIYLKDPLENIGAETVKNVASKANTLAGDGTTTATTLAQAIYNEGVKMLSLGFEPLEFTKGIRSAKDDILRYLEGKKSLVTTDSPELNSIAMVSSNGDEVIAKTITDIYKELGLNAVIHVIQGDGIETEKNIVKGMQFDRGYLSPYSITDQIKMKTEFDNPLIYIYDGKITDFSKIFPAVEYAGSKSRPLIIVAENVQDDALRGLVVNHMRGNVMSAVVMSPGYGKKRLERLEDMAILFGGEVFTPDNNDPETFNPDYLGEADQAEITSTDTAFIGGKGDQAKIDAREIFIKEKLSHYKGNKYETGILEERLGKLTSGVAVVKVGAASLEEAKELLARVKDCKFAVKAALAEGIVEGGGMALYNASEICNNPTFKANITPSFMAGYNSLSEAAKAPFRQILINAGKTPEVIVNNFNVTTKRGYDVKQGVFVKSMVDAGIIDPFKVVRIALESSVSIVGTLLTSNYAVINEADATVTNFT